MAKRCQETGNNEDNPTPQNQHAAFPNIPQDAQKRFDHVPDNPGQAERQANLDVIQLQVSADERPGCIGHTEDEFVDELNQEKEDINHGYPYSMAAILREERV